jgi:hypothetical protein
MKLNHICSLYVHLQIKSLFKYLGFFQQIINEKKMVHLEIRRQRKVELCYNNIF